MWFLGGLHTILRQRDEHGFLAPVVLASGAATVTVGMVSDLAGTVAGLLAAQHSPADPSLTRALLEINTGAHLALAPLAILTATLAAAILQGAIGARWVGWLSALSSAACLLSVVIGSLDAGTMVPPLGLLGFFITVTALSVSMLRDRSPAPAGRARQPAGNGRAPVARPRTGPTRRARYPEPAHHGPGTDRFPR
jgi:hypothetical protein